MKKHYIGGEVLTLSQKETLKLKYYILEENIIYKDTNEELTSYGVQIESRNENFMESNQITDVTTNREEIMSIGKLIRDNKVTPIHLNDVIEDLILNCT